jgi:hypothetical protein
MTTTHTTTHTAGTTHVTPTGPGATGATGTAAATPAAPLSPVDAHKQAATNASAPRKTDSKTAFLADAIAAANLYPQPNSYPSSINNPGLLTRAWDPANYTLPTDGEAIRYPDIDTGSTALDTFVSKIMANPPSTQTPPPAQPLQPPFTPDMTIVAFAQAYAPSRWQAWTQAFCSYAGVSPDKKLSDVTA